MAQEDPFAFEVEIVAFLEKNQGASILHTLEKPDSLSEDLHSIIAKSTAIEKAAIETGDKLNNMFNQTVGRHRFAKAAVAQTKKTVSDAASN